MPPVAGVAWCVRCGLVPGGSGSGSGIGPDGSGPDRLGWNNQSEGHRSVGSVVKKRRKRMAKKKHRKLLRKTRVQRRNKK